MRVFVAGGTGVVGRTLIPLLIERGHQVAATTSSPAKLATLTRMDAEPFLMDGLDEVSVGQAVANAAPDVVVHQMTAISLEHGGKPNMKQPDKWFASTNALRTKGTDHLLAALEVFAGQVQTIRTVLNPEKLGHLGEVADAWEVVRLTNAARRAASHH